MSACMCEYKLFLDQLTEIGFKNFKKFQKISIFFEKVVLFQKNYNTPETIFFNIFKLSKILNYGAGSFTNSP